MIVYVVTKGDYSDYHICGVALDKERAKKLAMLYADAYEDCSIEEYDTEEKDEETLNSLVPVYRVVIKSNGDFTVDIPFYTDGRAPYEPKYILREHDGYSFIATLTAKDKEHAFKIANDKRYKMISELFGL